MSNWVKASSIEGLLDTFRCITDLQNNLDDAQQSLNTAKDDLAKKAKEIAAKDKELIRKMAEIKSLNTELERTKALADDYGKTCSNSLQQRKDQENQLNNLRAAVAKKDDEIRKATNMVDKVKGEHLSVLKQKADLELLVDNLRSTIAEKDNQLEATANNLADLETKLETSRKEILEKSDELAKLQATTELVSSYITPVDNTTNYKQTAADLTNNYREKYDKLKTKVQNKVSSLKTLLPKERKYKLVFSSAEDEMNYHMDSYNENIRIIFLVVEQLAQTLTEVRNVYEEDIRLLDSSYKDAQKEVEEQQKGDIQKITSEINLQIKELEKSNFSSKHLIINTLNATLNSRKQDIIQQGLSTLKQRTSQISLTKDSIKNLYEQLVNDTLSTVGDAISFIDRNYASPIDQVYSLANCKSDIWLNIKSDEQLPPTTLLAGCLCQDILMGGKTLKLTKRYFIDFLNRQNLIIRYNKYTKTEAMRLVNSLLGRLLASSSPGLVNISIFDTEELGGTSNVLNKLTNKVYNLYVKDVDVKKALEWMRDYIANVKFNLLQNPINTLQEYNLTKETKQPYHIIVFKGFPMGFRGDTVNLLNSIMRNGLATGVHVILLTDEDAMTLNTEAAKMYGQVAEDALKQCMDIDTVKFNTDSQGQFQFDLLDDDILQTIVKHINGCFEVKEDEIIRLADYVPAEPDWWQGRSDNQISIPFGLTSDRQVAKLLITQKDAQNTALVIGKPGSGKSVFLHSVICNAIVNYSPEELCLYLIDFSGVEFNTYATHRLPHARVIAPEAEREFGLSILDELVEEGARRVSKCNEYDVSNIVDLKKVNPDIKMPRILIIIDEFQKLFEVDDKINVNASTRLHIIIKEFRKFGINLILATQSLRACSGLPTDLIANRILFKSAPDDFSRLISLPQSGRMPLLKNGECIYNEDSGAPYANVRAKGFFIGREEIDKLLDKVTQHQMNNGSYTNELRVFRANDLPDFATRRIDVQNHPTDNPRQVGIYFGESITVSDTDVNVQLKKEGGNNILVIGGEQEVAQNIAYYATLSATTSFAENQAAMFYVFNFIREADVTSKMNNMLAATSFEVVFATSKNEVKETLKAIQDEVRRRKAEDDQTARHIFLSFYAFQLSTAFEPEVKGAFNTVSPSEASEALVYILKEGPSYGVFTILQADNLDHIAQVGKNVHEFFNYRIALQMTENESYKIVSSSIASKIYDMKRPSSKFRAYCRDRVRNTDTKFKPYK